jgi:putative membrane protein
MKMIYFVILITHILLSAAIVPLVLFTYARGFAMEVEKHKKLAHYTWPLWLYVTASGVIVYLMISPCYPA